MLDQAKTSENLALAYNQHVSTVVSSLWAQYALEARGPEGLQMLFRDILPEGLGNSSKFHMNDSPVGYPFFVQEGNWFPNHLCLKFYENLCSIEPDLFEVGRRVAGFSLKKRNIIELRLLNLARASLILRNIARVNARFAKNKKPKITFLGKERGDLRLNYLEGFRHTEKSTDYYRGFIVGVLEFMGFRDLKSEIVSDSFPQEGGGVTDLSFTWEEKSFPQRLKLRPPSKRLTIREREIVRLLTEGFTLKEICYLEDISYETVKFHLANARKKLHCRTSEELVAKFVAIDLGHEL